MNSDIEHIHQQTKNEKIEQLVPEKSKRRIGKTHVAKNKHEKRKNENEQFKHFKYQQNKHQKHTIIKTNTLRQIICSKHVFCVMSKNAKNNYVRTFNFLKKSNKHNEQYVFFMKPTFRNQFSTKIEPDGSNKHKGAD